MKHQAPSPTPLPSLPDEDPRFVALEQVFNFRDLGGLATADGRRVRTGRVFRSDQFGLATAADLEVLVDKVGLKTVVDLRFPSEIAMTGSFAADRGVDVLNLELKHIRWDRIGRDLATEPSPVPFLIERYTAMAETGAETIKNTLDLMCEATPMVFHCMAGKDRTGIIAGVSLSLLGVAAEDIAADYALTKRGMARHQEWLTAQGGPNFDPMAIRPDAEAMLGLLSAIEQRFGSVERYAQAIGFTRSDDLKAQLLH